MQVVVQVVRQEGSGNMIYPVFKSLWDFLEEVFSPGMGMFAGHQVNIWGAGAGKKERRGHDTVWKKDRNPREQK